MLASLRVSGQLLINEAYNAPWCVRVPDQERLAEFLGSAPDAQLMPFHLVRRGAFELHRSGRPPLLVQAGQVAFVPSGGEHRLVEGRSPKEVPLERLLGPHKRVAERATSTSLLCGVFALHDVRFNPLFSALPEVALVSFSGPAANHLVRGVAELLVAELSDGGGRRPWVVARLLELLCGEAILEAPLGDGDGASWLRAVKDPSIGRALSAFHRAPAAVWSVERLARQARLSPSRFAARFRETLGESPMSYTTSWRMACAARRLRETEERVEEVGRAVGYDSLPAFSRAFKRQWGQSPAAARQESRAGRVMVGSGQRR